MPPRSIPSIDAHTFALRWQAAISLDELEAWIRTLLPPGPVVTTAQIRQYLSNKAANLRRRGVALKSYRQRRLSSEIKVLSPEKARQALAAQAALQELG